jgi:flagellar basal-body rod modification protein FlgD
MTSTTTVLPSTTTVQYPTAAAQAAAAVPGAAAAAAAAASAASTNATTLGGTDFMTLMLAQLQNQDPTSPVDSNTFLTQLSQLSEVQGITQLNSSFTALSNSLTSSQAMQASSLLGTQALVSSSTATLSTAGTPVTGAVAVPQTTSSVIVNVLDGTGALVKQISIGAQATGVANFTCDGTESNGSAAPAGTYSLSATVAGVPSGTAVTTYVSGTVESVTMGAGATGLTLNVAGVGSVPFASIEQISP